MKLLSMSFENSEGCALPETITVELTLPEVVAIGKLFGKLNHWGLTTLNIDQSPYEVISSDIINPYFDDGLEHFRPVSFSLDTLNIPPS